MFVVAFAFRVLLKSGIPPSKTRFRACNINAAIVNPTKIFSFKKLKSWPFSIFAFLFTMK